MTLSHGAARRLSTVVLVLSFAVVAWAWQEHAAEPADKPAASEQHPHQGVQHEQDARTHAASDQGLQEQLVEASREAAGAEHGEHAEFKQSASVRWLAGVTGLEPVTAYWVFVALNFLIIFVLLFLLMKSRLPSLFRTRTETIQKSLEEARNASEEARRRLSEIEGRLAKLDSEIAAMAATAEKEAGKEEQRILEAAEEDKRKIVQSAEQEIAAATKLARNELRAYVAELAVALAEKRIQVAPSTDQELVRAFVDQLGKDGR